ncbi:MAG TPA: ATP-binding protein [Thermohalobaculum sp.]|nr:ATP-binding protein [Thermohalobaculum sp.]
MSRPDFEAIWHGLPAPTLTVDQEGRIGEVNATAEDFLGQSARQLAGQPLDRLAGPESRAANLMREVLRRGVAMAEFGVEFGWPDRPPRLVDLHAVPLADGEGGAILLFHPRTAAESMDRSLNHRGAARSLAGMAALIAHEVKNPLAGISGAAQLLEMNADEGDRELTRLIRDEADRIGELMARVEQFGDIGPGRYRPVNIHDVLDRAVRSARAGFASHLRVIESFDPSLPPTLADPDQLMQVMLNLLKNAAEATPKVGGILSVGTAYRAGMKIALPGGGRESLPLQVTIGDNGAGVPEELQRHIFDPFVTSKSNGSGLGLALVSKIVADHGGVISCESQPGWTMFRMLLPLADERAESGPAAVPEEAE